MICPSTTRNSAALGLRVGERTSETAASLSCLKPDGLAYPRKSASASLGSKAARFSRTRLIASFGEDHDGLGPVNGIVPTAQPARNVGLATAYEGVDCVRNKGEDAANGMDRVRSCDLKKFALLGTRGNTVASDGQNGRL